MQLRIRNAEDFWSGLFFIGLGVLAIYLARDHQMGTALDMGPGYFPTWLGGIMVGFGVLIGGLAFKVAAAPEDSVELQGWAYRPWLVLPATLAVFAKLMDAEVGFVPSLIVLIIGCSLAHKDVRWIETIVLSIVVTAATVAIFIYGLKLPYRMFWWSP